MTNAELRNFLKRHKACNGAMEWIGGRDLTTAWAECQRGDWMLWAATRAGVDLKLLRHCALNCARHVEYLAADYHTVKACNDTMERWLNREATDTELMVARQAVDAAVAAAYAAAYAYAHDDAAHADTAMVARQATYAAVAAAYVAAAADTAYAAHIAAVDAAYAAAYDAAAHIATVATATVAAAAAYAAAHTAADVAERRWQADMVRGIITVDIIEAALKKGN